MKLSHSQHLTKTPDFSGAPNLKRLILEGCTSLVEVHPSIGFHKKLIFLNLDGCKNLKSFSSSIHMESLQILTLSGCFKLNKFPEVQGKMEHLPELSLEGTAIKGLPSSIENLSGLVSLNLTNCKKLASLPQSICELSSLRILDLCGCSELKELPYDLGSLQCLVKLKANGSGIQEVPPSINLLTNLQVLSLAGCKGAKSKKRTWVSSFSSPTIPLGLPASLSGLSSLTKFFSSPTIPLGLPASFSGLSSLTKLNLSDCNLLWEGVSPIDLTSLSSLVKLNLSRNNFIMVPTGLSGLSRLKILELTGCINLQSLPELPASIEWLTANDCTSLETFSCSLAGYATTGFRSFNFQFSNCPRLMGNDRNDNVKHILQGIQLLASGSEIARSNPRVSLSLTLHVFLCKKLIILD